MEHINPTGLKKMPQHAQKNVSLRSTRYHTLMIQEQEIQDE